MNLQAPDSSSTPAPGSASWSPWREEHPFAPRPAIEQLLRCEASLTAALRDHSGDRLGLEVVRQDDARWHGLQAGLLTSARGVVREVVLSGNDRPWVFAQTLIPAATIDAHPWVVRMGGQPLGDALFHHEGVERSDLSFATLEPGMALFERVAELSLTGGERRLWARRSYFYLGEHRLLITEVFLPPLCRAP